MELDVKPGVRVVRGPDWKWGNQDGGEGHVGTVVEVTTSDTPAQNHVASRVVLVQWDIGNRCNYRCGIEGKHDLLVYDNGPTSVMHQNIVCDSCRENGIQGIRWKCTKCFDFDLCTGCYMSGKHSLEHQFERQDSPEAPMICMPARGTGKRIQAKGLFANASVSRGHDWIWGDQDGGEGSVGTLEAVIGWEKDTYRSVAEVLWQEKVRKNVYRIGHKGKVDIKTEKPGDGLLYFPSHLPVLGKPHSLEQLASEGIKEVQFATGDLVRIEADLERFKTMQDGHGGWNDAMKEIMSKSGTVHSVLKNGDLRVRFDQRTWTLNSAVLAKQVQFSKGDPVRILNDISMVYQLQEDHGGWIDDMALSLDQVGRVANVFPTGDVRVSVNGRVWTYNPMCLIPAPGENPPEVSGVEDVPVSEDMDVQLKLLSILENPAVIVAAAANGEVSIMRDFLKKHPNEVNTKAAGKAAIHCASVSGNMTVLKCLLEFNANLEVEDEDGDRPLHLCAYGDEDEAAQLLIGHGANVNALNGRGVTPLILAAAKGHVSVLKVLIQCPAIEIAATDVDGDNALHHGVLGQKHSVVSALLEAGFDTELVNFRLFTPIHEAARIGFLPAMEIFIKHVPSCVKLRKDDGYTPLHLAATNDHLELLTTILESDQCDIDITNNELQTPLHIAVHQGHGPIVERLVGFGANLNLQDKDGDTPLHVALMRETLNAISNDTPQLKKVRQNFNIDEGSANSAVMACFLVQEGAGLYLQNHKGNTPLLICSPDVAALVTKFVDENKDEQSTFHGSLSPTRGGSVLGATGNTPPLSSSSLKGKQVSPPPEKKKDLTSAKDLPSLPPIVHSKPSGAMAYTVPPVTEVPQSEECRLCDSAIDIVLKPCNHAVICRNCSKIAKKCPSCQVRVTGVEDITPKCSMCDEEDATVTLKPCGHKFCPVCCARPKKCMECKVLIEEKIGLPDCVQSSVQSSGSHSRDIEASLTCEICCELPRNTVLTCGHQFCETCAHKVDSCPVCRKFIRHRILIFN